MKLNETKTVHIFKEKIHRIQYLILILMTKYVGLVIDEKLTWCDQINILVRKILDF